jgi:hypothetical protein
MKSSDLTACVIGSQGALGNIVADQLAEADWTVYRAGRRRDTRAGHRQLDLDRPETVAPALRDVDLVISTVPDPQLVAERIVLEQGGVMVNCSHAPSQAAGVLHREVKTPKGRVVLNGGLVPGVANLAAVELLSRHPEADCLEVAFTILSKGTSGKGGAEFAYEGLTSRSHQRVTTLPLPPPFGDLHCLGTTRDDDFGFGGAAGPRKLETYLGFPDLPLNLGLRTANALRMMRLLPKLAFTAGRGISDGPPTREPTTVWLGARRGRERVGRSILECEGDYRTTAEAARVFGEMQLADDRPGCFNPEDLFSLDEVLPLLTAEGMRLQAE